ncbi:General transcription factor IIF subunit 2, partial [Caligus rogercresseyi]
KVSDKDLFTENRKRGVWLVKVPKYIADRWEKAPENETVGKLRIVKKARAKPDVSFSLDDKIVAKREGISDPTAKSSTNQAIPKQHKFIVSNVLAQALGVFSRGPLEGRVVKKAECRPISDKTYMSAIEPTRQTVQLDRAVNHYKPISNHAANIEHARRKKEEGKKSRDDKEKVMERLFELFEKHQYYNIRTSSGKHGNPSRISKRSLRKYATITLRTRIRTCGSSSQSIDTIRWTRSEGQKNESSSDDED